MIGEGRDARPGDVGFHLFAESFGGPTTKLNVVPGNGRIFGPDTTTHKNLNTSRYASMEALVRHARNKGKNVTLDVQPVYLTKTSTRPDAFTARVTINGDRREFEFENAPVARTAH